MCVDNWYTSTQVTQLIYWVINYLSNIFLGYILIWDMRNWELKSPVASGWQIVTCGQHVDAMIVFISIFDIHIVQAVHQWII